MWRVFRIAMMWLLAVALPLQGSVAATLRVCGPGHERMAAVMQVVADHDHGAHHHDDGTAVGVYDDSAAAQHLHQHAQHKCSACAACCVTAGMPAATLRFEATPDSAAPPPAFSPGPPAFLTDGPERPPRSLLA